MRRAYAGEIFLPPPTLRTLHHLEGFSTTSAILDDARRRRPPKIQPELSIEGEKMVLALPGDPRHSETEPALPGPTRIVLADGRWHLEG